MAALENDKYETFCQEYIIDLNASKACVRAGYSENASNVKGAQLLAIISIQERIAELQKERSERCKMSADDVFNELVSIAKDDIGNYLEFDTRTVVRGDREGTPYPEDIVNISVKDSETINTKNIKSITRGKDGQFKFELYSRDSALAKLGEHLGMFTQKIKLETDPVDVSKFTHEEMIQYISLQKKLRG